MSVELVIFDCDGVLVDSEGISNEVLAAALGDAGLPTTAGEALAEYRGLLLADVVARAEARLGSRLPPDFVETFERDRAREFELRLRPVAGAADAVGAIRAEGVSVCVASQGRPEKTELTLRLTGLRGLFAARAVFSAYEVPRGKPHPDLFLHTAAAMGAAPEACVVVEDTTLGVAAAQAAGMRAIAYAPGGDGAELRAAGAKLVRSMTLLPAAIRSS